MHSVWYGPSKNHRKLILAGISPIVGSVTLRFWTSDARKNIFWLMTKNCITYLGRLRSLNDIKFVLWLIVSVSFEILTLCSEKTDWFKSNLIDIFDNGKSIYFCFRNAASYKRNLNSSWCLSPCHQCYYSGKFNAFTVFAFIKIAWSFI